MADNDDWEAAGAETVEAAARSVAAFPLLRGSKDAALVVSLAPNNYTAIVSGAGGATGVALLEIYELP